MGLPIIPSIEYFIPMFCFRPALYWTESEKFVYNNQQCFAFQITSIMVQKFKLAVLWSDSMKRNYEGSTFNGAHTIPICWLWAGNSKIYWQKVNEKSYLYENPKQNRQPICALLLWLQKFIMEYLLFCTFFNPWIQIKFRLFKKATKRFWNHPVALKFT